METSLGVNVVGESAISSRPYSTVPTADRRFLGIIREEDDVRLYKTIEFQRPIKNALA